MAWNDKEKSPLDAVKVAIGKMLIDFKAWSKPETKAFDFWKGLEPKNAIKVAPSRMIDDIDAMLSKYRQQETDKNFVAPLPVMIIALAPMVSPPDVANMRGIPFWLDTVLPTDPKKRPIKLRTIPKQFRVQIAFVSAEGDTAQAVMNQFVSYMQDDFKRRFKARYHLGAGVFDDWHLTVLENSLYPDSVPTGQNNMWVNTCDFEIIGLLPQVVGLDGDDGDIDPDSRDPNNPNGEWSVIVEADLHKVPDTAPLIMRAKADKDTGDKWVELAPNHD